MTERVDQMVDQIMSLPERNKIQLVAPVVRGEKEHPEVFEMEKDRSGYVRVTEEIKLDKKET